MSAIFQICTMNKFVMFSLWTVEFPKLHHVCQPDEGSVFFSLHLSIFVPLQWSVSGVFPVFAHLAAAAQPQHGHHER